MAEGRPDFNGSNYDDTFIGDLVNFVASGSFQTMFEKFFLGHALFFSDDEEHKLEYMEYYQEFHGLFEEQLEIFCREKGITQAEFMARCADASTEDPKAKHYIQILLSSVEYDTFVKLMKIMRPVAERRKQMEAMIASAQENAAVPADSSSSQSEAKSDLNSGGELDSDDKGVINEISSPSKEEDAKGAEEKGTEDADFKEGGFDDTADAKGESGEGLDDMKGIGSPEKAQADEK